MSVYASSNDESIAAIRNENKKKSTNSLSRKN